jgi:hypothetical protein
VPYLSALNVPRNVSTAKALHLSVLPAPAKFTPTKTFLSSRSKNFYHPNRRGAGSHLLSSETQVRPLTQRSLWATSTRPLMYATSRVSRDGMINIGNSCYINAVLQVSLALPSFVDELTNPLLAAANNNSKRGGDGAAAGGGTATGPARLFRAVTGVASQMMQLERGNGGSGAGGQQAAPIDPSSVKRAIASSRKWAHFSSHGQEDAHEFYAAMIDTLSEELADVTVVPKLMAPLLRPPQRDADQQQQSPAAAAAAAAKAAAVGADGNNNNNNNNNNDDDGDGDGDPPLDPAATNFGCIIRHTITCSSCFAQTTKDEFYRDFSIEAVVDDTKPILNHLLMRFFRRERVHHKCEQADCGSHRAYMHHHFVTRPRVLVIHLKRFKVNAK